MGPRFGGGQWCWEVMVLVFQNQNVVDIYFSYPVAVSDRNLYLSKVRHLISSASYSRFIPPLRKSFIMCESLGFRFGVFS